LSLLLGYHQRNSRLQDFKILTHADSLILSLSAVSLSLLFHSRLCDYPLPGFQTMQWNKLLRAKQQFNKHPPSLSRTPTWDAVSVVAAQALEKDKNEKVENLLLDTRVLQLLGRASERAEVTTHPFSFSVLSPHSLLVLSPSPLYRLKGDSLHSLCALFVLSLHSLSQPTA
jgi:hypothetical protein